MKNKIVDKILYLAAAIALAGAAGALGASLAVYSATSASEIIIAGENTTPVPRTAAPVRYDAVTAAARGAVVFYRARAGSGLDGVFLPGDAVGEGVAITSDGWLMTAESVLAGQGQLVAVFADGRSATVPAKATKDAATGLVFFRVEADRLSVAPFGNDASLLPGEDVFVPQAGGFKTVSVAAIRAIPAASRNDFIESSEKLSRRLVLDSEVGLAGAPIIDPSGSIVAVSLGGSAAVPAPYFSEAMKDVFRGQKINRPVLGVRYLSVAGLSAEPSAKLPAEGALITGAGKTKAVAAGSAAELAGLRENDVVIYVERDKIEKGSPLADLISEYLPGAKIELTVLRSGKEMKVPVTLK